MKYYLVFTLLFGTMLGWQVFLIQRDTKLFEAYKQRTAQLCQHLPQPHPDCK